MLQFLNEYPRVFAIDDFYWTLREIKEFLINYTLATPSAIGAIAKKFPYFLEIPFENLKGNVKLLLHRQFEPQQILSIVKNKIIKNKFEIKFTHKKDPTTCSVSGYETGGIGKVV